MEIKAVSIAKWETYQPRKDRANHTWFRLENTVAFSKTLHGLTPEQKWFWICLLATASKDGSETVVFDADYFADTIKVSKPKMLQALKSLEARGAVTLSYGVSATPDSSLQTDKQTDRQTDMVFDFEPIYSGYPRKEGKAEGMTRLKRRIKTQDEFDSFAKAVRKYASVCKLQGKDQKYILKWSSFVGTEGAERWLDHVDTTTPATLPFATQIESKGTAFSQESMASERPLSAEEIAQRRAEVAKRFGSVGA